MTTRSTGRPVTTTWSTTTETTRVYGGSGTHTLSSGTGSDTLNGGGSDDELAAGDGNDKLYGGSGNDRLDGGSGNDTLKGQNGHDTVLGGAGEDRLWWNLGGGNDWLAGDNGYDRAEIYGNSQNNLFTVTADADGRLQVLEAPHTVTLAGSTERLTCGADPGETPCGGGTGNGPGGRDQPQGEAAGIRSMRPQPETTPPPCHSAAVTAMTGSPAAGGRNSRWRFRDERSPPETERRAAGGDGRVDSKAAAEPTGSRTTGKRPSPGRSRQRQPDRWTWQ
ncbi:MAG: hypothetical protein Ct9H300mP1_37570 [Planctomycetaceae bacterium]|nr:MAG: hypothetical protein Ct9H300mP1_37570 [Planctomycetaceae bacterium]